MNASDMFVNAQMRPDTTTHTRLRGRWLWAARIGWVALAVAAAALITYEDITRVRLGLANPNPLNVAAAEQLGVSPIFFVWAELAYQIIVPLGYTLVGLFIFLRRSDERMALLTSSAVVSMGTFGVGGAGRVLATTSPVWGIVYSTALMVMVTIFGLMMLTFPSGRSVPAWAKWVIAPVLIVISVMVYASRSWTNLLWWLPLGFAFLVFLLAGIAAQVHRYRRVSTPAQRQQTKWILVGFAALGLGTIVFFLGAAVAGDTAGLPVLIGNLIGIPLNLALPAAFAFSILRYRLWDIDFVMNRGLVYGGLTALLGVVFVGGFFGLQAVLKLIFGNEQAVVAAGISGAAVVGLFAPARRWLRAVVDRRVYGINVDYQRAQTPTPSPVASSGILRTQLGAYEHLEPIGRGGMAEVYRATHPTLDKTVAVKVLPPALAREEDFRRRFEREARVVAGLKHPNIVQVFDFGEAEGTYYMVMEFVAGHDLGEVVRGSAPLPLTRVVDILADIASALDYAHAQGLVHRDVKPSNVMLEPITATGGREKSERAVLMDFGVARILSGKTRLTASGMMGTLDYIAPEQIQDAADVDGRADVYSLGVMTYQMLTGKLPFTAGHPAALLIAHLNQPAPDPRDSVRNLPEGTAGAVVRAMSKRPDERFSTAGEFARAAAS